MSQYKRIFLIADPSMQRTPAFDEASWLARATGASLHIALFDYHKLIASVGLIDASAMDLAKSAYMKQREAWLAEEASVLIARGINVTTEVQWVRHPLDEILAHVQELKPDLVVKSVHLEPLVKRIFFTPLDWHLIRQCPVPLLLAGAATHHSPRRIIAAVDPSADGMPAHTMSDKIIRTALGLAMQCDAQVHLFHALEPVPTLALTAATMIPVVDGALFQEFCDGESAAFAAFAEAHGVPEDRRKFAIGDPASAIAEFVGGRSDDIVVLGTTQRSRLDRILLGSTAERLVSYAPCNLLVIKPDDFVSVQPESNK